VGCLLGAPLGGAVETGPVGHHDQRNPGRLLRTRRRRETPAGELVRQPEDVGAPAAPGHPGGAAHSGTDHAGQRLARGDPRSPRAAHHRARPGRGPGTRPGGPALAGYGAEPAGRGRLHRRADGVRVRLHRVRRRRLRRADPGLGVLAAQGHRFRRARAGPRRGLPRPTRPPTRRRDPSFGRRKSDQVQPVDATPH